MGKSPLDSPVVRLKTKTKTKNNKSVLIARKISLQVVLRSPRVHLAHISIVCYLEFSAHLHKRLHILKTHFGIFPPISLKCKLSSYKITSGSSHMNILLTQ